MQTDHQEERSRQFYDQLTAINSIMAGFATLLDEVPPPVVPVAANDAPAPADNAGA